MLKVKVACQLLLMISVIHACSPGLFLQGSTVSHAQKRPEYKAIYSGVPWFDNNGELVSAHGACIVKDKDRYFLFGEKHSDTSNAFAGFTCYSSSDLYNWKFESMALPVQPTGKLGPGRVGERPKVMKCPATGEYIMYMHVDTLGYRDQYLGYATAENITGPYSYRGPLLFEGKPIRKWDMGTFQDTDGSGYVMMHGGDIYQLSADYKTAVAQVCKAFDRELEAPAMFRKDSIYYLLGSHLSSWEKNDNYYFTATSLKGPWTNRGLFAPKGTLTWYSQTTFVLPIQGEKKVSFLFMGDRWSYPKQRSAATYVWQPMLVEGTSLSVPEYHEAWKVNTKTGVTSAVSMRKKTIVHSNKAFGFSGAWKSDTLNMRSADQTGATCSIRFKGRQVELYGLARPTGGYATVQIVNEKGKLVLTSIIDMYCKYPVQSLSFLSPVLPKDNYTISVTVMGERGNWWDKRGTAFGSTGYVVSLDKLVIMD